MKDNSCSQNLSPVPAEQQDVHSSIPFKTVIFSTVFTAMITANFMIKTLH
jgi:hypothetical protein